jgi:hypothetical protein
VLYLNAGSAMMGDAISAEAGKSVTFKLATQPVADSVLRLLVDGKPAGTLGALQSDGTSVTTTYEWRSDGQRHWVRAELDDANGDAITLTNPIYVNWRK